MSRFILVILDGFGIGYTDDAYLVRPQDVGANTCRHILEQLPELRLPNLEKLGLMNALGAAVGSMRPAPGATYGRSSLAHVGADTFYGHQEIMGTKPKQPLMLPFSACLETVFAALVRKGYQTEVLGQEARFLLVEGCVTVADNIEADPGQAFNVTAALDAIPFERVVAIGQAVREAVPVSRVIALGGEQITIADLINAAEEKSGYIGIHCPRSGVYRHGYRVIHLGYGVDPAVQVPTLLGKAGIDVILLGKVADIVDNPFGQSISCVDTQTVMELTLTAMAEHCHGFIATNIQETDLAGHGEDVVRYAAKLVLADRYIGKIMAVMDRTDILLVMADHGNDPTIGHSHHTREYVPLLAHSARIKPGFIGHRTTLSDVGATVSEKFSCPAPENGTAFLGFLR